ncbi:MAG: hypothetical protein HY017_03385 [Betaproteobacteria bacterium]|nr:hypothetical protein [Betaproteobacteria bacterium]
MGTVHVVLPWSQDEFLRTSVLPFDPSAGGGLWETLFKDAIKEAATIRTIGQVFDFAHDAGLFALELVQMIEEGKDDWLQKGLYLRATRGSEPG